jgi:hypothetical protein
LFRPRHAALYGQDEWEVAGDTVEKIFLCGRILLQALNVWEVKRRSTRVVRPNKESMMKRTLIRYKTKPDMADRNAELIVAVFEELKAAQPEGVRYLSLRLDDGTFVHFVETESDSGAISGLAAFKAFQSGIRERCIEPPQPRSATIVGNYRMLAEP